MAITITPAMELLLNLMIQNAIIAIFNQVESMTPEEIEAALPLEELRKKQNDARIRSH